MDLNEFEQDRMIDPAQLDVEAVRQADLFFKWAERAVQARLESDRLKLVAETVEARLSLDARRNPEEWDLEKTTEATISAAVKKHTHYLNAMDEYYNAKEESELLNKAVQAMEMKKRMLESLITLHGQQYFAGPGTPRDIVSAYNQHQVKVGERINDKQKARSRKRKK